MTTGDGDHRAAAEPPIPLAYARPADPRRPAPLPYAAVTPDTPPKPRPPPDGLPALVRPGPLFGLTVAGLFVLLVFAVVVMMTVVGR